MNEKAKRSKLPEKPVRVPSIQLERKAQVIRDYLGHVGQRPDLSEYARGVAFVQLLKDLLLDAAPQFLADYLQGMEHSLGGPKTALYSQGRVDALYGNLVIEFKRSLPKSLQDAKRQLARYLSILLSSPEGRHRPLIALATDGVQFAAYAPRFPVGAVRGPPLPADDISLVEIESGSLESMTPEAASYWLDRDPNLGARDQPEIPTWARHPRGGGSRRVCAWTAAAEVWGITDDGLKAIQEALAEAGKSKRAAKESAEDTD